MHAADVGVRGYGRDPDEAFAQTTLAMIAAIAAIATPQHSEAHEATTWRFSPARSTTRGTARWTG